MFSPYLPSFYHAAARLLWFVLTNIEALGKKLNQSNSLITLNRILKVTENNVQTNLSLGDLKSLYSNYKPALKNMHKATIDGENLIEDDGIWYFEANEDDKSVKINNYKNNLK